MYPCVNRHVPSLESYLRVSLRWANVVSSCRAKKPANCLRIIYRRKKVKYLLVRIIDNLRVDRKIDNPSTKGHGINNRLSWWSKAGPHQDINFDDTYFN